MSDVARPAGRRVYKSSGKLYWYGAGDEILPETDGSGNTTTEYIFFGGKRVAMQPASSNPLFYVEDFLDTSRVIAQNNGVVCYDGDFTPFGGEVPPYTNSCPAQNNYKFEGKERDTETSNDDFGARYYSWRFGRWLSADWSAVPVPVPYANLTNPQTLNLYAMVADDPESFADLDGHVPSLAADDRSCYLAAPLCTQLPDPPNTKANATASAADNLAAILNLARTAFRTQEAAGQPRCFCQNPPQQQTPPPEVQEAIKSGQPPNGEYNLLTGKKCQDCKYYSKEVQEAVNAHEDQHRKDEHTLSGFFKLFTKKGRAELEVSAFKAELTVVDRHLKSLQSFIGPPTQAQQQNLIILGNMRDQAVGVIQNPGVYQSAP